MKFLSKIKKGRDDEEYDDLDLEDEPGIEDVEEAGDSPGRGLFRGLFGRLKGDADDTDDTEDTDGNGDDTTGPDEDPPIQRVRLEGVADVRPVGPSVGTMTPPGELAGSGQATEAAASSDSQSVESKSPSADGGAVLQPGSGDNAQEREASPGYNAQEREPAPEEDGHGTESGGIDISLKDIFEEAATVDESLKDLADSQEDIRADDLAGELREFLSELGG